MSGGGMGLSEVDPARVTPKASPGCAGEEDVAGVRPPIRCFLLPPSLDEWLARGPSGPGFVAELVDEVLDLSPILAGLHRTARAAGRMTPRLMGAVADLRLHHPAVRSSRAIRAHVRGRGGRFRYPAAGAGPDYRSISRFRARHLHALADIFTQSLPPGAGSSPW